MLSLGNAFSDEEVTEFVDRVRRFLKLDAEHIPALLPSRRSTGCRCRCATRMAMLVRARRAAMASNGEDVTANVRTIKDIPHTLKGRDIPAACEMRGEVYMLKKDFLRAQQEAGGGR